MMSVSAVVLVGIALLLVNLPGILVFFGKQNISKANNMEVERYHEPGSCEVCGEFAVDDAVRFGEDKVCPSCREIYQERLQDNVWESDD